MREKGTGKSKTLHLKHLSDQYISVRTILPILLFRQTHLYKQDKLNELGTEKTQQNKTKRIRSVFL